MTTLVDNDHSVEWDEQSSELLASVMARPDDLRDMNLITQTAYSGRAAGQLSLSSAATNRASV